MFCFSAEPEESFFIASGYLILAELALLSKKQWLSRSCLSIQVW